MTRRETLLARPVRAEGIDWEKNEEGEIEITIKLRPGRRISFLRLILPHARRRVISLDLLGSEVWELCDGKNTVEAMIGKIAKSHKLNWKEAEIPLLNYLKTLGKKGIIGFAIPCKEGRK